MARGRKRPTERARLAMQVVEAGHTVKEAARASGLPESSIWNWVTARRRREPWWGLPDSEQPAVEPAPEPTGDVHVHPEPEPEAASARMSDREMRKWAARLGRSGVGRGAGV